jgi:hypothetical protein
MAKLKREQLVAIAVIAIVALLGINAYLLYANKQQGKALEQSVEVNTELESLKSELDKEYNLALEQLNAKKSENEELNDIIEQQKNELKSQKMKIERSIRQGKNASGELAKAKRQIQDLVSQRDTYLARIEELSTDNEKLVAETTRLSVEKESLESTLTDVQVKAKETEEVLTKEKEELETEKTKLSDKVARGSVLNTRNIAVTPLKLRRSGKEVDTKYASKTEKLKICFDVDENVITKAGNNKILLRILTPLGETLYLEGQGSGEFSNQSTGGSVSRFTTSKGFEYDNQAVNMCLGWGVQTPLSKGTYTAEIYNKGYKVGASTFVLK